MERFKERIRSPFRGKKVFRSNSFCHLSLRRKKDKFITDTALIVPNIIGKNSFKKMEQDWGHCASNSSIPKKICSRGFEATESSKKGFPIDSENISNFG